MAARSTFPAPRRHWGSIRSSVLTMFRARLDALLGFPDTGVAEARRAIERARGLRHVRTMAVVLGTGWDTFAIAGEAADLRQTTQEWETLANEQGFQFYQARARYCSGWVKLRDGDIASGHLMVEEAVRDLDAVGSCWTRRRCTRCWRMRGKPRAMSRARWRRSTAGWRSPRPAAGFGGARSCTCARDGCARTIRRRRNRISNARCRRRDGSPPGPRNCARLPPTPSSCWARVERTARGLCWRRCWSGSPKGWTGRINGLPRPCWREREGFRPSNPTKGALLPWTPRQRQCLCNPSIGWVWVEGQRRPGKVRVGPPLPTQPK